MAEQTQGTGAARAGDGALDAPKGKATSPAKAKGARSLEAVAFFDVVGADHVYDEYGDAVTGDVVRMTPVQAAGDYPKGGAGLVMPAGTYELHLAKGAGTRLPAGTRVALRLPVEVVSRGAAADDDDADDES